MSEQHEPDRRLAEALARGEESAFDRFFGEYFPKLYRFARARLDDEDLVKDMVQQTLCQAVRSIGGYRGEAALYTWLCRLCLSEISAHARKQRRRSRVVVPLGEATDEVLEQSPDAPERAPDAMDSQRRLASQVHELLDGLPEPYGRVLEWKYIEGLSVEEIAERLERPFAAAQSLLARARRAMREALDARRGDLEW